MIHCTFENDSPALLRHVTVDVVLFSQDKTQVVLVRRAPFLSNPNKLAVPGGYLDRDETLEQGALRECKEETGYRAKLISLFQIIDAPDRPQEDRQNISFVFLGIAEELVAHPDNESSEITWYNLDKLPDKNEFAFDHYELLQSVLEYGKTPFILPQIISHRKNDI
ncbi:NUDIX hydrolase [Candidatus Roizmanbacteria bacterium]|nr:NUDIX hydrolase [Candidatus Roizmanbacteria bacterium]